MAVQYRLRAPTFIIATALQSPGADLCLFCSPRGNDKMTLTSRSYTTQNYHPMNATDFRNGVMPRAQLSMVASQLAVNKATQKNAKEFAGFELMEATTVIAVLKDVGTPNAPLNEDGKAFIEKLESASGNEFDKLYMHAELTNHEFLSDLAESYLKSTDGDKETRHLATLALFAFNEHVALCKRIYGEVNG
jgi:putative membrane protein